MEEMMTLLIYLNTTTPSKIPTLLNATYQGLYVTIGIVGIVGNLIALVVLLGYAPLLRNPANYFIINQTFIDFLVSAILIPTTTVDSKWLTGTVACFVWKSRLVFLVLFTASIYSITALTVERYFKTVHPIQHRQWMTRTRLKCAVVVVSLTGILLKLPYAIGGSAHYDSNVCRVQVYPTPTVDAIVGIYNFFIEYFFPLFVIAFCYIQMARSLRRNSQVRAGGKSESRTITRARKNIIKTLLYVVVVFVICTTWKQIIILVKSVTGVPVDITGPTFNAAQIMSYLICCADPVIYIFHYDEFRIGLGRIFLLRKQVRPAVHLADATTAAVEVTGEKF